MSPRLVALLLLLGLPAPAGAAETPHSGRLWLYLSGTAQLTPEWGLTLMPGIRYEFSRTAGGPERQHYLDEVLVGPTWSRSFGDLSLRVALWYYFIGYPPAQGGGYPLTHNLELIPAVAYRWGDLTLSYRAIFHNTLYASIYDRGERWGLGTVMRNLVQVRYQMTPSSAVLLGTEPWFGILENGGTPHHPAGYWKRGFRLNRINAGFDMKLARGFSLSPQYVLETAVDAQGKLAEIGHHIFLTAAYTWSPSSPPAQDVAGDSVRSNRDPGGAPFR